MKSRSWPYRTPQAGRVAPGPWLRREESLTELTSLVEQWDYTTDLELERRVDIDVAGCLYDAGLPLETPLRICVRVRPSTSKIRSLVARCPVPVDGTVNVSAVVHGAEFAGSLTIETVLELAVDRRAAAAFSPSRSGSILWRDDFTTVLEGDSGLLPVAPVSFAQAGLPSGAVWYLSLDAGRWEWTAMGSLLLLLNSDNPSIAAALTDPDQETSIRLLEAVGVDFVADLVGRALLDEGFWESYGNDEEVRDDDLSVGSLVRALVRTRLALPTEDVRDAFVRLLELLKRDPSMYRARVQEGTAYLRSSVR